MKTREALNAAFSEISRQPHVVNAVAWVDRNRGRIRWSAAHGLANPSANERMTINHVFRTASVTKTFTGVLIMQLIESGALSFETPVHEVIGRSLIPPNRTFDELHVFEDERYGNQITVRQLLCHTSGLADYWFDKGLSVQWKGKSWIEVAQQEAFGDLADTFDPPSRLWQPNEIVEFFFESGLNRRAHFRPGQGYLYSDTNYLLLGAIIEKITGESLAKVYRARIYDQLSLLDIYKEYREPAPISSKLAHHFWYLREENLNVVERRMASTAEWANGGQVSSVRDLSRFIRGLFRGKLFDSPETLELMLDASKQAFAKPQSQLENGQSSDNVYSCGLSRWDVDGTEVWGHTGFWGIGMFYIPRDDVSICFATNQVATDVEDDMRRLVSALRESGILSWE